MKSLFRAEFFRFTKQRSTWIIPLVLSVLSFFMAVYMGTVFGTSPVVLAAIDRVKAIYEEAGLSSLYAQVEQIRNSVTFDSVLQYAASNVGQLPVLSMCLFALFFYVRPQFNGTARSMVNSGHRNHMVFVNAIFILIFSVISVVLNGIFVLPGSLLMFSGSPLGSVLNYVIYLLVMILLVFAAGLLIQFIVMLSRRPFMGAMFAFFYVTALSSLLYELVDKAVEKMFGVALQVERFTVFGAISTLIPERSNAMLFALIAAIFFGTAALVLSFVLNRKRNY